MTPGSADLLGHRATYERLRAALVADTAHHAWLFVGPSGVGKALVARRLVLAANCEQDEVARPCMACTSCRSIQAGSHPDVVAIAPDAGKKTQVIGVEAVREVVRKAGYHRYRGRRRFFVIDPAHAMTVPAANALLKTLEEPPAGTAFILISHQANSLLPTILSRCQRVTFPSVPEAEVAGWLAARGVAEPDAIARLAMGCPGRALELADGAAEQRKERRQAVLRALRTGDVGQIFELSKTVAESAKEEADVVATTLEVLEELLRDAVVYASGASVGLLEPSEAHTAKGMADILGPVGVTRCAAALDQARRDLEVHVATRLVLDALFLRFATELGTLKG